MIGSLSTQGICAALVRRPYQERPRVTHAIASIASALGGHPRTPVQFCDIALKLGQTVADAGRMGNVQGQGTGPGAGRESDKVRRRSHLAGSVEILVVGVVALATAITFLVGGTLRPGAAAPPAESRAGQGVLASSTAQASPPVTFPIQSTPPAARPRLTASGVATTGRTFSYGYDIATAMTTGVDKTAATQATTVAQSVGGFEDVAIMGWGPGSPEVSPGVYNFTGIARQIAFVQSTGNIPVITLCGAPDWMKGGQAGTTDWSQLGLPPLPQHYQDFANLSAAVAQAFPQVKYFVVWSELRGFWSSATNSWDAASYTTMYNDVYQTVKGVRPDAMVGGPYVSVHSLSGPASVKVPTPFGPWGHLDAKSLWAIAYWLSNKVGADFIAVDGRAFTNDVGLTTDPLTSTSKYAAVDQWLTSQTTLPIMWTESHLLPDPTIASQKQQAALRIAALVQMASSGASLGMQWDPQGGTTWDEGLWTDARYPGGGQPTVLARELPAVLNVLAAPVTVVAGTPPGTLVASGADGTITVTYSTTTASVVVTPPTP